MAAKNVIIRTAALERAYKSRTEGISMEKLTVEQALEALLEHTKVIEETETVPLLQACGRVLAKDMIAGFDNPPFDRLSESSVRPDSGRITVIRERILKIERFF